MSSSDKDTSGGPKEPPPIPLGKLQLDAICAAVTKQLMETDLFKSLRGETKEETASQKYSREKREGKQAVGDTSHIQEHVTSDEEEQALLRGIQEQSHH